VERLSHRGSYQRDRLPTKQNDPSLLWNNGCIIVIHTDDTIITGPDEKAIDGLINEIGKLFKITHSEAVSDFLGVNVVRNEEDGAITMTQPLLIQSIIRDMGLTSNSNGRAFPSLDSKVMTRHTKSALHNDKWNYRGILGKLNYLEKSTRPDISYAVHQCARHMESPRYEHAKAVKAIVRYLIATHDKGLISKPNGRSVECYCDADFSGNYEYDSAFEDGDTGVDT
jgi:Reverse transcriptase (RNA-dependent DNA polymerase)